MYKQKCLPLVVTPTYTSDSLLVQLEPTDPTTANTCSLPSVHAMNHYDSWGHTSGGDVGTLRIILDAEKHLGVFHVD